VAEFGNSNSLKHLQRQTTELLQKISVPIERKFGQSPLLLKLATLPIFVPIWSRTFNFKGDTRRSLQDVADYLKYHGSANPDQPFFMFINMMETHLPYFPPQKAVEGWLPYWKKDREARAFLQKFNTESYRSSRSTRCSCACSTICTTPRWPIRIASCAGCSAISSAPGSLKTRWSS
jgi:hypothetical protein